MAMYIYIFNLTYIGEPCCVDFNELKSITNNYGWELMSWNPNLLSMFGNELISKDGFSNLNPIGNFNHNLNSCIYAKQDKAYQYLYWKIKIIISDKKLKNIHGTHYQIMFPAVLYESMEWEQ